MIVGGPELGAARLSGLGLKLKSASVSDSLGVGSLAPQAAIHYPIPCLMLTRLPSGSSAFLGMDT